MLWFYIQTGGNGVTDNFILKFCVPEKEYFKSGSPSETVYKFSLPGKYVFLILYVKDRMQGRINYV